MSITAGRTGALTGIGAVMLVLIGGCSAIEAEPEVEVVRIAADLELSGDLSHLGTVYRNALELRVEQVNEQDLLRSNRRLELVVRDNRSDAAVASANLNDFANDPSFTAIVSGACWRCLESALDLLGDSGIPTISLAAPDAVVFPVDERRNVFKLGPNAQHVADALMAEVAKAVPAQDGTLALITTDDEYGQDGVDAIVNAAGHYDINIVINQRVAGDGGGVLTVVQEIASYAPEEAPGQFGQTEPGQTGPNAVVIWGLGNATAEVAASLREVGYSGPLFLDPSAAYDLFTGSESNVLNGATMIFVEALVIDEVIATSPAKAARKNWFNSYTARYGTYHAPSSFAADAINIIVDAINQVDTTDRGALRNSLESLQGDGFTGPLRMTPENHSGVLPQGLVAVTVRGDRWRLSG